MHFRGPQVGSRHLGWEPVHYTILTSPHPSVSIQDWSPTPLAYSCGVSALTLSSSPWISVTVLTPIDFLIPRPSFNSASGYFDVDPVSIHVLPGMSSL